MQKAYLASECLLLKQEEEEQTVDSVDLVHERKAQEVPRLKAVKDPCVVVMVECLR